MSNGIVLPRHRKLLQRVKKEMRERGELKSTPRKQALGPSQEPVNAQTAPDDEFAR
jgi:hypothetical protein